MTLSNGAGDLNLLPYFVLKAQTKINLKNPLLQIFVNIIYQFKYRGKQCGPRSI